MTSQVLVCLDFYDAIFSTHICSCVVWFEFALFLIAVFIHKHGDYNCRQSLLPRCCGADMEQFARISPIVIFTGVSLRRNCSPEAFLIPTALPPSVSDKYFAQILCLCCCVALVLFCFVFVRCPCSRLTLCNQ